MYASSTYRTSSTQMNSTRQYEPSQDLNKTRIPVSNYYSKSNYTTDNVTKRSTRISRPLKNILNERFIDNYSIDEQTNNHTQPFLDRYKTDAREITRQGARHRNLDKSKDRKQSASLRYKSNSKYKAKTRDRIKDKNLKYQTFTNNIAKIDSKSSKENETVEAKFTMSKEHENLLFPVLKRFMKQIELAKNQEYLRIKLAHTDDFNLPELYKCFSTNKKPYLTQDEFMKGCRLFGFKPKHKLELSNIFKRYSRRKDDSSRMYFKQFSDIFLAHDTKLSLRISQRMPNRQNRFPDDKTTVFSHDTNQMIGQLLSKLVEIKKIFVEYKLAFQLLSTSKKIDKITGDLKIMNTYLLPGDLLSTLNEFGFDVNMYEAELLVKMYDTNQDGRISFVEFATQYSDNENIH